MPQFRFSEDEARRMRRGVYLFPLIILPFIAVFGLDASKSQPAHFLIILSIGLIICGVFLAIARAGVRAQIRTASATTLTVSPDRLTWTSDIGQSELLLQNVATVNVIKRFGDVRTVVLKLLGGSTMRLEGYERMHDLVDCLGKCLPPHTMRTRKWFFW